MTRIRPNLTQASLSAAYGRTYRPESYGAVGDGVANDRPAFAAMAAAINAAPTVPARIEVSKSHYLSDSVSFDAENIECYLAEGSHVFTTAATTDGHTLGFIGHIGQGTAVTPRRAAVKVHGPGKVTGWTGGSNENAIGVVRFERALVDGPYVNAGNKGVTAQIGVPYVTIRNIRSDAALRAVSIEDQAGAVRATVEGIRFGTCTEHALFVSAAWISVKAIVGDEAWTNGGTTAGAVHLTTASTLSWALIEDVEVTDANSAKGVVISQAQDFHVGNVRIGSSTGNAVDLFNCTGGTVGVVTANGSPTGATATGTTPAAKVRRINGERNGLTSGEATLSRLDIISGAISLPTGTMRLGYFEATKTETITKVRVISGGSIPTGVTLMRVGVYEVNDATGALTLVASTANDTTYPAATNTAYTKNLSASFVKKAGARYAVGLLGVFTGGALQVQGHSQAGGIGSEAGQSPRLSAAVGSQTDLFSSLTVTSAHDTSAMPYFVLVP